MIRWATALAAVVAVSGPVAPGAAQEHPKCGGKTATIVGSPRRERIVGTDRNDVVVALGGNDEIVGGPGHDRICAGDGNDLVNASIGDDFVSAGGGNDEIHGGVDFDRIVAGGGADEIHGERHRDEITPGAGDDVVRGGKGLDRVRYSRSRSGIRASLDAGRATGQGTDRLAGVEGISGTKKRDALTGDSGRNVLVGGAGDDAIRGLGGFDRLVGGDGGDRIVGGDRSNSTSFATAGRGVVVNLAAGTARGQGRDRLLGIDTVILSRFEDVLRGSSRAERVTGLPGGDRIRGEGGADVLSGSRGNDRLSGGGGRDRVDFSDVRLTVVVDLADGRAKGQGRDALVEIEDVNGSRGRDVIRGDGSANTIFGNSGDDDLFGRSGNDLMGGNPGNDLVDCGPGSNDEHTFVAGDRERVRNCEANSHADRSGFVKIIEPDPRERISAEDFRVLRAREISGVGRVSTAKFAVRRKDVHGCDWWNRHRRRLVPGSCRVPVWFKARRIEGESGLRRWRYEFPHALRRGRYRAMPNIGPAVRFRLR